MKDFKIRCLIAFEEKGSLLEQKDDGKCYPKVGFHLPSGPITSTPSIRVTAAFH